MNRQASTAMIGTLDNNTDNLLPVLILARMAVRLAWTGNRLVRR